MFYKALAIHEADSLDSDEQISFPSFGSHRQYPVDWFGRKAGLASSQVHQIVNSADGRIWAATPSGLACYDGVRITTYGLIDGLKCHGLRALEVDHQDVLWVGSDAGVQRFSIELGNFESISWDPCGVVETIAVDQNSAYIGTTKGLFTWNERDGMVKVSEPTLAKATISDICITKRYGTVVIGPEIGLAVYFKNEWAFPSFEDIDALGSLRFCVRAGDDLLMIAGDRNFGVFSFVGRLQGCMARPFKAKSLCWDKGTIIAANSNQILSFTIENKKLVGKESLAEGITANHLRRDLFGNIWMSTESHGIGRISGLRHAISYPAISEIGSVLCIKKLDAGIVIGGMSGLMMPSGRTIFSGAAIWDVAQDDNGGLWFASDRGLYRSINGLPPEPHLHRCHAMAAPSRCLLFLQGNMLVGSIRGLTIVDGDTAREILTEDGHPLGYVYSLFKDREEQIWVTTLGKGLWKFDGDGLTQVVSGSIPAQCNVTAMVQSSNGDVFVAHDNCISRMTGNCAPVLFSQSRDSVSAWTLNVSPNGHLLAGSTRGLIEFDTVSGQLLRRISDVSGDNNWEFTTSRSLVIDHDGKLLCGLASGLAEISLNQMDFDTSTLKAQLSNTSWVGVKPQYDDNQITVEEGKWRVDFDIRTCWYVDEVSTRMRFRLLGFEAAWSKWTAIKPITYSSLPAGTYTLAVELKSPLRGVGADQNLVTFHVRGAWKSIARRLLHKLPATVLEANLYAKAEKRILSRKNFRLEQLIRNRTVELQQINENLLLARDQFDRLAHSDPLTGIANRRQFDKSLECEFEKLHKGDHVLSLILLDIDHFKSYNDRYGHAVGDECLKRVALALRAELRKIDDLVARVGGEEFAVILPRTDEKHAEAAAERLRRCIERLQIPHQGISEYGALSISLGVASVDAKNISSVDAEILYENCDKQLYFAKKLGRNGWSSKRTEDLI